MIRFTYDGKEFEFSGEYNTLKEGMYFLSMVGDVMFVEAGERSSDRRAIVHPVPVIHEFGGVKFVETGEKRFPINSEWYLYRDCGDVVPVYCHQDIRQDRILSQTI